MKIKYRKKRLNKNAVFGILWLLISLLGFLIKETPSWTDYGFLIIAIVHWGAYFYEKNNDYLTIEDGMIFKNKPFGRKIEWKEITQVKKFAGDYILKTDKTELTINTQIIDEKSLEALEEKLKQWNLDHQTTKTD